MSDINERLMKAAKSGSAVEMKALLREPGCDALAKDDNGMTALMWAAWNGHEACVRVMLQDSDALAQSTDGMPTECMLHSVGMKGASNFFCL